ncbi:hypothetical protein HY623_02775 [Candidatus Uhrbacteria bacterium]|nr:hypothetical protein [Candidatus Uhrbacteria bacterium]
MSIPLESRADSAREAIRGLGLQDTGLDGFLGRIDRAMARQSPQEREMELRSIEQDIARWKKVEGG